ncbi:MAG: polyribonucleotide nucleotidyltransferase [Candidatus Levybacteria bacterium RIFCSPHIGHO2_02_FULL_42_12]|nr:MAG: polyribonucleotide nucleotidyltransferase [Candidatus Levybacteria bacterium RIFCSPHIGHO2_02_FULL_42_12]OGH43095.1 MAG: polyribonucleotide nucleotidyltransferase [Candidatus Levybacteria bacterium RIFCSPLOWO2_01_FULL_42_15]
MKHTVSSIEICQKTLTLETGTLASQATASVLGRLGDTMVLATVVAGSKREDLGYFPLFVEYIERLYAGGRIKGSRWVKREGRPSDDAILTARLIDRSIRPLFPKEYVNEVQVVVTVLSVDGENNPDILSIVTVSAALTLSGIPWNGPVGSVRMGFLKEGDISVKEQGQNQQEFLINPRTAELEFSELDMVVSQTQEKTLMIEAGASEISEEILVQAATRAHKENKTIIAFIQDFVKKAGAPQRRTVEKDEQFQTLINIIEKTYKDEIVSLIKTRATHESSGGGELQELIDKISADENTVSQQEGIDKKKVAKVVEHILFKGIRELILTKQVRPDGRKIDEIRPISGAVSVLPRTHGSALFQRGDTQALTVVTLGSPRMEQLIEGPEGEEVKRYIHHYSMPPYSVGEVGRMGVPSRREIGHGALAERALLAVIPKQETFPYTVRVVSEILSSNGSTSMASACGSTLALMDAGVPIKAPVAGIAMGMMSDEKKYVILSDIIGLEDFSGDMDFKAAGTEKGVCAIQLDVKTPVTIQQIEETLKKAKIGRLHILKKMLEVLPQARDRVSTYAPKIEVVRVPVEKIGEVIGPGGKVIRGIMAGTSTTIDVEDDGSVTVSGKSEEDVRKAADWIKNLTRDVGVGEVFEGTVKRMLPFGAFVEILPGKEGLVHVSQMSNNFVKSPQDVVSIGDKVKVKVIERDEQGRINLSMLLEGRSPQQNPQTTERRPHPLSMQFQRERSGRTNNRIGGRPSPRRSSRY